MLIATEPRTPRRAIGKLSPDTKYTGSTRSWVRCHASRPHIRNRLARTIPRPYSAASVSRNTAIRSSHWSTENVTPNTVVAMTRTAAARVELITNPPTAIPKSTAMMFIGAAK